MHFIQKLKRQFPLGVPLLTVGYIIGPLIGHAMDMGGDFAHSAEGKFLENQKTIVLADDPRDINIRQWKKDHYGQSTKQQSTDLYNRVINLYGTDSLFLADAQKAYVQTADKLNLDLLEARENVQEKTGTTAAKLKRQHRYTKLENFFSKVDHEENETSTKNFKQIRHDHLIEDERKRTETINSLLPQDHVVKPDSVQNKKPDIKTPAPLASKQIKTGGLSKSEWGITWNRGAPGPRTYEEPVFERGGVYLDSTWLRHRISLGGVPRVLPLSDSTAHWDAMVRLFNYEAIGLNPTAVNKGKHYNKKKKRWERNTAARLPQVTRGTQHRHEKIVGKPYPKTDAEARSIEGIDTQIDYTNSIYVENFNDLTRAHGKKKRSFIDRVFISQERDEKTGKVFNTPCVASIKAVSWPAWAGSRIGQLYDAALRSGRKIAGYPIAPNTKDGQKFSKYLKIMAQDIKHKRLLQKANAVVARVSKNFRAASFAENKQQVAQLPKKNLSAYEMSQIYLKNTQSIRTTVEKNGMIYPAVTPIALIAP